MGKLFKGGHYSREDPNKENTVFNWHSNINTQGQAPISLVRATRIFSKAKTLKKNFDPSLAIGDGHGQA